MTAMATRVRRGPRGEEEGLVFMVWMQSGCYRNQRPDSVPSRRSMSAAARWVASSWSRYWLRASRSEEHTSELQSQSNLVCRLLLEKKKKKKYSVCAHERIHYRCQ